MKVYNFKKDSIERRTKLNGYRIHVIPTLGWFVVENNNNEETLLIDPEDFNAQELSTCDSITKLIKNKIKEYYKEENGIVLYFGKDYISHINEILIRNKEHTLVIESIN